MNDKIRSLVVAVHSFLVKLRPELRAVMRDAPDGRGRQGRRWKVGDLLGNAILGLLAGTHSLRAVEALTEVGVGGRVGTFGGRRMPDNTLHGLLEVSGEETVNWLLARLAHAWQRARRLMPVHGLTIRGEDANVLVYDGKQFMQTEEEEAAPYHLKTTTTQRKVDGKVVKEKRNYWAVDIVRCVLVSAAANVCLRLKVADNGDEVKAVQELDVEIQREYRWLKRSPVLVVADAKHANQAFVKQQGDPYGELLEGGHGHYYVLKLKGNAGLIYKEALRAVMRRTENEKAEAQTEFENVGHGRRIKRELWRTETNIARGVLQEEAWQLDGGEDLAIISGKQWPTVRQVILVKQTTIHKQPLRTPGSRTPAKRCKNVRRCPAGKERTTVEWRLAITNIKHDDASARALLHFIRMEWGIEVYHNLLDQVLREDDQEWARRHQAPVAIAGLHSAAANVLGMLKMRHLRSETNRSALSFPQLVSIIMLVIGGSRVARILAANATQAEAQTAKSVPGEEPSDEFSRCWSNAEYEQLLVAIKTLFGCIVSHFLHLHQVTVQLTADVRSGTTELRLITD